MDKLKPCPFCGGEAELYVTSISQTEMIIHRDAKERIVLGD